MFSDTAIKVLWGDLQLPRLLGGCGGGCGLTLGARGA